MSDMMDFPKTVEEFMEMYKMVDTEEVYSNGTEYVPIFRMKQWFEHQRTSNAHPTHECVKPTHGCVDLIRRQAVINTIRREVFWCDDLIDKIKSLPSAQSEPVGNSEQLEWIPCSERLPLPDENPVIVSWMGIVNIGWYSCGRWETGTRLPMDGVEAWKPLPEPWKGEEDEADKSQSE